VGGENEGSSIEQGGIAFVSVLGLVVDSRWSFACAFGQERGDRHGSREEGIDEGGAVVTTEVPSPTHVVVALIAMLDKKFGVKSLPTDRRVLHSLFFKLKESHPELLSSFAFDTSDAYPYCPVLDEAIANMQATNGLKRTNPEMAQFDIDPSTAAYFNGIAEKKFRPDDLDVLEELSRQWANELKHVGEP